MRLAIINDYQAISQTAADWSQLPDEIEATVFTDRLGDPEETVRRLLPFEIVLTAREETRFSADIVAQLPNLKLLVTHGLNNKALDLQALKAHGVTVSGTELGFTNATVETTWALILGLHKNLYQEAHTIRSGGWGAGLPMGLTGKTLGILGLGELGAGVARVGLALDMEVIAWSENLTRTRCEEIGVTLAAGKDELFSRSDVLSVHLRLGERSVGAVGARELSLMKPTAFLVNTARGEIVDEAAMIEALASGKIAGAGFDVFDTEPLPADHVYRRLDNVLATAHIGGRTTDNFALRYRQSLEAVLAWLEGAPVRVIA
ncbi:MAG: D-2-hydroxyacid dehydrogenase family protein [Nisaea sp.]|uniref:D-2-hydroxyacid dehydrogenase family protein n=1 Tax=Nisaea sp. TaxID=2024842 RepID=UPI001B1C1F29|nr:D-2-hydroxyacid dehydrogenase family protein [Nisaea sp.]MBO6561961.1 D-2-hydroxyacid dehydrogenase family protein [Nisaea sp.]